MMKKERLRAKHMKVLDEYGLAGVDGKDISLFRYKSGEYILQQGYPCPYVLIFLEGKMKVFVTVANGRTLLICYYSTNGIIGEVEFAMDMDAAASSVQAITEVLCIGIVKSQYQNELRNSIKFMNAANLAMAQKLFHSNKNSAITILTSLETRLCAYIDMTNIGGYFRETLTEIAEVLGTSYRHLLRTLENLCRRGVLEKTPQGYFIADTAKLRRISDDYYLR